MPRFGAAALLAAVVGCSADGDAGATFGASLTVTEQTGAEIARGVLGAQRGVATDSVDHVADGVVSEIEAESPGRLAQIATDLRSRDPERVIAAKLLLDASISGATASPAFLARISGVAGIVPFLPVDPMAMRLLDNGIPATTTCTLPGDTLGQQLHLGKANGRYGDDRVGLLGAAIDTKDLVDTTDLLLWNTLKRVDDGTLVPDPESRLGAYASTRGYDVGTTGNAVHNAIGTIYVALANYGQEKIGRVFGAMQAKALYDQPVTSCAGVGIATLEYRYWADVVAEDPVSPGGRLGAMFNPKARDFLQQNVFDR